MFIFLFFFISLFSFSFTLCYFLNFRKFRPHTPEKGRSPYLNHMQKFSYFFL